MRLQSFVLPTSHLMPIGFVKSLLDGCLWLHRMTSGEMDSLLVLGTLPERMGTLQKMESQFRVGKFEPNATFAGRRLFCKPDWIQVSKEKYILLWELHALPTSLRHRAQKHLSAIQERVLLPKLLKPFEIIRAMGIVCMFRR